MAEIKKIKLEDQTVEQTPKEKSEEGKGLKWLKWLLIPLVLFIVVMVAVGIPTFLVVGRAQEVYASTRRLQAAFKTKDLKVIQEEINQSRNALDSLEKSLAPLAWLKVIPVVGDYRQDAVHLVRAGKNGLEAGQIVVGTMTPYADLLGFSGGQALSGEKTAQDRITLVVTTLDKILPEIDKIGAKVLLAKNELQAVDPNRYPETFRGQKIREPLREAIDLVDEAAKLTNDAKPLLTNSSWLLGNEAPRRYLVLFQNDGELRPTGGFITAYAILEVEKGKIKPVLSEDIYAIDARYKPDLKAPEALVKYVPLPYGQDPRWRLRDMNLSPDFVVSMETFAPRFQKTSGLKYDGIVAVDTKVLADLLRVLGPIGVPGWGNFSAQPDSRCGGCPQVVYELERLITKPLNRIVVGRKAVVGPLMHSILANAFGSPKDRLPGLVEAGLKSLEEKHVLFYFTDPKIQSAMESLNLAGRIKGSSGDYFHLNDSNFSGAKVNIFIKQGIEQKVEIGRDGTVTKTVVVQYKNPSPPSDCNLERGGLCLNAPYRDWVRIYVPKGSQLIESSGFEGDLKTYDELDKTVFDGFFGDKYPLRPLGQAEVTLKYKLPFKVVNGDYQLLLQKQPGVGEVGFSIEVNGQKKEFELRADKELRFRI